MSGKNSLEHLSDAIDLLNMLEHLTKGYSKESPNAEQIPWAGINLTLHQARTLLQSAEEDVLEISPPLPPVLQKKPPTRARRGGASLASRVMKVPSSKGYVRELREPRTSQGFVEEQMQGSAKK